MTKWQSRPLAAMSLWDYDDLQKALKEYPEDTRRKLLKRITEFLTKFREDETDVDLVGQTVILLNRVGAWSNIPFNELVPILRRTNKKTRSVLFEELPGEISNSLATAMQNASRNERTEERLRLAASARLARKANREEIGKRGYRVIAETISESRGSASPLTLVEVVSPSGKIVRGPKDLFDRVRMHGAAPLGDDLQSKTRDVEIYGSKKRKKVSSGQYVKV